jgi:hypothetical protein
MENVDVVVPPDGFRRLNTRPPDSRTENKFELYSTGI